MALTKEEKMKVTDYVKNLFINFPSPRCFSNEEIRALVYENFNYKISPQTLGAIISDLSHNTTDITIAYAIRSYKENGRTYYTYNKHTYYSLIKEKSQVFLVEYISKTPILIYDYSNNHSYYDENNFSNTDKFFYSNDSYPTNLIPFLNRMGYCDSEFFQVLPEWVYSYPEIFERIVHNCVSPGAIRNFPTELGKNDIKIAKELFPNSWYEKIGSVHRMNKENPNFLKNAKNQIRAIEENFPCEYDNHFSLEEKLNFLECAKKILINSIKNYHAGADYYDVLSLLCEAKEKNCLFIIDLNRDYKTNRETLEEYYEKNKNRIISENLKRLNFLNMQKINDKYMVIVPQDVEDLIREGQNQNNCVGHYYNNSIAEGINLIYFIRKIESPTKSYITCRYTISNKATSEYRYKNNEYCEEHDLICTIDNIIRKNLNTKGEN